VGEIHLQKRPPRFPTRRASRRPSWERAQFAVSIREYRRAEDLLVKATTLCPDAVEYWMALGEARRGSGQQGPAEKAYGRALDLYRAMARSDPAAPEPRLFRNFVLARMGHADEARAAQARTEKQFPTDFVGAGICARQAARSSAGEVAPVSDRRPEPLKERFAPMGAGALSPRERRK